MSVRSWKNLPPRSERKPASLLTPPPRPNPPQPPSRRDSYLVPPNRDFLAAWTNAPGSILGSRSMLDVDATSEHLVPVPSASMAWRFEPHKWTWFVGTILALVFSAWSARMLDPEFWHRFPAPLEAAESFSKHFAEFYVHLVPSVLCLVIGPFQFLKLIRSTNIAVHRWLGRIYVASVAIAAITAFELAITSFGDIIAHTGFAVLAFLWFVTLVLAYQAVLKKDIFSHRDWMIRNFAMSFFGVTFNVYILTTALVRLHVFGLEGDMEFWEYGLIAWVSWVPNLIAAELHIRLRLQASTPPPPADAGRQSMFSDIRSNIDSALEIHAGHNSHLASASDANPYDISEVVPENNTPTSHMGWLGDEKMERMA